MTTKPRRLGRQVALPPRTAPTKYHMMPCPCCGHEQRVVNGRWLAFLRQRARLDQRALAATIGVSGPYLSDIERNRRVASDDVIEAYTMLDKKGAA